MESSARYNTEYGEDLDSLSQHESSRMIERVQEMPGVSRAVHTVVELKSYPYQEDPFDAPGVTIMNAEADPMGRD